MDRCGADKQESNQKKDDLNHLHSVPKNAEIAPRTRDNQMLQFSS